MSEVHQVTKGSPNFAQFSELEIIKEAAARLQRSYRKDRGDIMRYGSFRFVIHDGYLRQVEEHPKHRRHFFSTSEFLSTEEWK